VARRGFSAAAARAAPSLHQRPNAVATDRAASRHSNGAPIIMRPATATSSPAHHADFSELWEAVMARGGRGFLDGYRADLVAVRSFREFKRVLERAYEYDANIEAQLDRFVNEGGARDKTDDLTGR
jgi:hypothetical protein